MRSLGIALFAPYLPAPAVSGGRIRLHRLVSRLVELGKVELFAAATRFAAVVERAASRRPRAVQKRAVR